VKNKGKVAANSFDALNQQIPKLIRKASSQKLGMLWHWHMTIGVPQLPKEKAVRQYPLSAEWDIAAIPRA
jgi:hypothetical protein